MEPKQELRPGSNGNEGVDLGVMAMKWFSTFLKAPEPVLKGVLMV